MIVLYPLFSRYEWRGTRCDQCAIHFYLMDVNVEPSTDACIECPTGAECPAGRTVETIIMQPRYWRLSNRTASTYECTSSACLGGNWNRTSDAFCALGYEGPLCEWCSDPDRYYDDATATCKACGATVSYAFRQIAILLAIAIAPGIGAEVNRVRLGCAAHPIKQCIQRRRQRRRWRRRPWMRWSVIRARVWRQRTEGAQVRGDGHAWHGGAAGGDDSGKQRARHGRKRSVLGLLGCRIEP